MQQPSESSVHQYMIKKLCVMMTIVLYFGNNGTTGTCISYMCVYIPVHCISLLLWYFVTDTWHWHLKLKKIRKQNWTKEFRPRPNEERQVWPWYFLHYINMSQELEELQNTKWFSKCLIFWRGVTKAKVIFSCLNRRRLSIQIEASRELNTFQ